jgi:hypothetical protein
MSALGRLPAVGDSATLEAPLVARPGGPPERLTTEDSPPAYRLTVLALDGRRVARVRLTPVDAEPARDAGAAPAAEPGATPAPEPA